VNEHYDEGNIIAQFTSPIAPTDLPKDIESKVRALEIAHFPTVIFETVLK
jgi:phosphoribosylglycinamide formyltransferase-1